MRCSLDPAGKLYFHLCFCQREVRGQGQLQNRRGWPDKTPLNRADVSSHDYTTQTAKNEEPDADREGRLTNCER